MVIKVVPYSPAWKGKWDRFVEHSNNGTIFHLQRFLEYHHDRSFEWHHLLFVKQNDIVAILPAAITGSTLESPVGASYGSFVTHDLSFGECLELVDAFSDYCRSSLFERTLLTPPPFIYQKVTSQNIDYALAYRGFSYDKHYLSHAVRVHASDPLRSFHSTSRRYVKKYLRSHDLRIELSEDFDSFYPILVKNKKRHGVSPTHSLEELHRLRFLLPGKILLFLVHHDHLPIAGSLVFLCNPRVALCFYNMLFYEHEYLHPIHAVMYEVLLWARDHDVKWVDIGVSQDTHSSNQMTPAMNLIRFKEQFQAHGILRSTFYKRFI